jgi:SOS-response transcriptional repressor LexA
MDIGGCGSSEPFALRVLGDSMTPEFEDGCVIVIDPSGMIESGSYVLAVHDEEYIFRQLIIDEPRYYLKPLNEGYEVLEIPGIDAVKGVIVQKAGTRRRHRKHYV